MVSQAGNAVRKKIMAGAMMTDAKRRVLKKKRFRSGFPSSRRWGRAASARPPPRPAEMKTSTWIMMAAG